MKLVLMQFLSLDGVSQGPGAPDEDPSGDFVQGGWFVQFLDESFGRIVAEWVEQADAFLFGRRTYENFARDWPKMNDPDDPIARSLNGLPKYVASRGLQRATWEPTTILSDDVPAQVEALKRQPGRELQIHGSSRLGQSLLDAGLVDEVRLAIAPVVLGHGRKLFREGTRPTGLRLVRNETTEGGLAIQEFHVSGDPTYGTYGID